MKTKKITIAIISAILSVLMMAELPVSVAAQTTERQNSSEAATIGTGNSEEELQAQIISEIEDKRTQTEKYFRLSDGNYMAVQYDTPVHYKDDDGKWVEYNNSLQPESANNNEISATADESELQEYTNKKSNIDIKLSRKAKAKNMIKVNYNGYHISWGYSGANKSNVNFVNDNTKLNGNQKFTTLKNVNSEAVYKDVYNNVDLQYFITPLGVKENIILKNKNVQNTFDVSYKINKLSAKQIDDYTIVLYDKNNKEVYRIIAPYMIDSKGASSDRVTLELVSQKGANLNVRLTVDKSFINSSDREFPITVDPELKAKFNSTLTLYEGINANFVSYGPYYMSGSGNSVVACVNSLPALNAGEKIVSAKFDFEVSNYASIFESENDAPIYVNAHKLTAKAGNGITYDPVTLDYDSLTYSDNKTLSFDLTSLANQWYNNGEAIDGFVMEAFDSIGSRQVNIKSTSKSSATPAYTIVYKDFTGMEGNLTYHSAAVGSDTQVAVGDYLGNLVITQELYQGTGSRMPVDLTAAYNSINYDTAFANGSTSGYGWQFSFNRYVRDAGSALSALGYDYIYNDSDGTDHYLKKDKNSDKWYDEDGVGITLTKDDNNIYIDTGSSTQTHELTAFGGKLLSEKDENNNTITYGYTDGNVTTITDASGRVTRIGYTLSENSKRATLITKPDNSTVAIVYTSDEHDRISQFTYSNCRVTKFNYDDNGRITSVEDKYLQSTPALQNEVAFTYNSSGQVTQMSEYGRDGTQGNYLDISYGNDNTTTFTDRQNRTATYAFDESGNQISVLNANGYIESSIGNGLSLSGGADSFTKNYITESTAHSSIGNNNYYYLTNGKKDNTQSSGGTCTIDDSAANEEDGLLQFFGPTSIKVCNPVSEDKSAFYTGATHRFNGNSFNGKDITFSAYVKTKNISQIYSGGATGAMLELVCYSSDGTVLSDDSSIGLTGTQDWQRISVSASVPENTDYICIYCNVRYASGTAWFDCLQLEDGNSVNDFNALQNGDFSSNSNWYTQDNEAVSASNNSVTINGAPGTFDNSTSSSDEDEDDESTSVQYPTYYVNETETEPCGVVTTYDDYGNVTKTEQGFVTRTVKKTYEQIPTEKTNIEQTGSNQDSTSETASQNSAANRYIYQSVDVGRAGVEFNISGEAKADSVALSNSERSFGITLDIYYSGETTPETHYTEFNSQTSHRQSISMSVIPDSTNKVIDHVVFAFVYGNNCNTMTVYNAMLNICPQYTQSSAVSPTESESDDTSDDYVDYEVLSESVDKTQTYMQTSQTYDQTGNYVTSETDEAGNTVTYTYDVNGNQTSVTDREGNTTNYTYSIFGSVASVSSGEAQNTYVYNSNGDISSINHNGFSYQFNYDVFNRLVASKIGNVTVASNTYSANNGNLIKTTYANGDYIEYTYDDYDNVTKIKGETGVIAEFVYNKKGLIAKCIDNSSERTMYYYYKFNGTQVGEYLQSENGELSYYLGYDGLMNQVEKISINGVVKTITTGVDDNGNSFVNTDGLISDTQTDDFKRKTQVRIMRDGGLTYTTNYEYADGSAENTTTNHVEKIIQKLGTYELANYKYTYDANGNIIGVYKRNGDTYTQAYDYEYDNLNQLIREEDYENKKLYIYQYDDSGNIVNKKVFSLNQSGGAPNLTDTINYSYTDSNWKDKLTGFDNQSITYDEMGNPLNYRDGMTLTWQNGRQLSSLHTPNNEITYTYDLSGLRTQKDDNDYTINYYYDSNKKLIGLDGVGVLYFYYDDDGTVSAMSYGGVKYFYVKNLQGDVEAIINQVGTTLVTYEYDAWGNIVKQTDISNRNLANINPFRYRGYIYDSESGLYYLQSRYYDPVTGRFINADVYYGDKKDPLENNKFSYCKNDAINSVDFSGLAPKKKKTKEVYNRTTAVNYAKQNCKRTTDTYRFRYYNGSDCANFVSQCLYYGGIEMCNRWHFYKNAKRFGGDDYTKSWTSASKQFAFFRKYCCKYVFGMNKNGSKKLKKVINDKWIQKGDLLYIDFQGDDDIDHATIINGVDRKNGLIKFSAHTDGCFDRNLNTIFNKYPKCKIFVIVLIF